jgi:hypothetical protein
MSKKQYLSDLSKVDIRNLFLQIKQVKGITVLPDVVWEHNRFIYKLGTAIKPSKEVRNGRFI